MASTFAVLLSVLCVIISYGVIEAWFGCSKNRNCLLKLFKCLRHWLLLPIFIFLVIVCWIFCTVFIVGSTAAADMCVDSPDDRVAAMLVKYGDFQGDPALAVNSNGDFDLRNVDSNSLILLFLLFIIQGCPDGESPQGFVESITQVLNLLADVLYVVINPRLRDA